MDEASEVELLRAALAERGALIEEQAAKIADLEGKLVKLQELLGRNSSNSNKPPSSDPPGKRPKRKKRKGKRRGGQKGHRGSHRELLPPEQVDRVEDLFPPECESCWKPLPQTVDPFAKRYQLTELEPLAVHTTEFRRHAVICPCCGYKTRAAYDPERIPRYAFGPRLMAVVSLLTGVYHLSRRQTVRLLRELLGVRISLGSVSAIERRVSEQIQPAVEQAHEVAKAAAVKHADGTSWLRAGAMLALWVVATAAVTVFVVLDDGRRATLRTKLLGRPKGILVSDRATALKFWAMSRRQVCWAHLLRKFISFSERDGPTGAIGQELVDYTRLLFVYWDQFRQGQLSRATLAARMAPVRTQLEATLRRAVMASIRGISGSCDDILQHREALWTFVETAGVEPTNNHAERELRGFVLWRRRSFGSQSERGDRFAARMMTIAHTARKQGCDVLDFLTACCAPGTSTPSLLMPA